MSMSSWWAFISLWFNNEVYVNVLIIVCSWDSVISMQLVFWCKTNVLYNYSNCINFRSFDEGFSHLALESSSKCDAWYAENEYRFRKTVLVYSPLKHPAQNFALSCPSTNKPSFTSTYWLLKRASKDHPGQMLYLDNSGNLYMQEHTHKRNRLGSSNTQFINHNVWQQIRPKTDTELSNGLINNPIISFGARRVALMY